MAGFDDLSAEETELRGNWLARNRTVEADNVCGRIEWLCKTRLVHLGNDSSGWCTLYRDPRDGRLWELTYPMSEMHGGGPPLLSVVDAVKARGTYGVHAG